MTSSNQNSKVVLKKETKMDMSDDRKSGASSSRGIDIPDFFLYTTLN